jgi:hypothetical protein
LGIKCSFFPLIIGPWCPHLFYIYAHNSLAPTSCMPLNPNP